MKRKADRISLRYITIWTQLTNNRENFSSDQSNQPCGTHICDPVFGGGVEVFEKLLKTQWSES